MFDSTPSNLPTPPTDSPTAQPAGQPPSGMINQSGIKEPEDIFADIKEPESEAAMSPSGPVPARLPTGGGFPWKAVIGIGIPLIVVALGVGGWYVYTSYRSGTKIVKLPSPTSTAQGVVPITSIPNNAPPPANPVPKPDEDKLAAQQAAITMMQYQAGQAVTAGYPTSSPVGLYPTSSMPETPSSVAAMLQSGSATSSAGGTNAASQTNPVTAPPNIPLPSGATVAPVMEMRPSLDSDNDGLTNSEEALLGTNPNNPDSDGDGFSDLSEIMNGYDPSAPKLRLMDSHYLRVELVGNANILIPTAWERKAGPGGTVQIMTGTPAVITISLQPYATSQNLLDWIVDQNQGTTAQDYVQDKTAMGSDVVYSKDKLSAWVLLGNTVYVFRYGTNGATSLDFITIFQDIMIRQVRIAQS